MKSPGIIYRHYRQLKRKLLYDLLSRARVVHHENCHYGKLLQYVDDSGIQRSVRMCAFDSTDKEIEICTNPQECNAFALKWTKDKVVQDFENLMGDSHLKRKVCPELIVLEWVLDKNLTDAVREPKCIEKMLVWMIGFLEKILGFMHRKNKLSTGI